MSNVAVIVKVSALQELTHEGWSLWMNLMFLTCWASLTDSNFNALRCNGLLCKMYVRSVPFVVTWCQFIFVLCSERTLTSQTLSTAPASSTKQVRGVRSAVTWCRLVGTTLWRSFPLLPIAGVIVSLIFIDFPSERTKTRQTDERKIPLWRYCVMVVTHVGSCFVYFEFFEFADSGCVFHWCFHYRVSMLTRNRTFLLR
jgi:hypothetical protein